MRMHAYPNPLFAPTTAGIAPGVGSPQIIRFTIRWGHRDRKMCPQSAGEVTRAFGFCFFTVCTACMHFWRRQRKRPWAATGAVRRKVIFRSSSATEQWGLGVGLGRVQFGGKCGCWGGPLKPKCADACLRVFWRSLFEKSEKSEKWSFLKKTSDQLRRG